PMLGPGSLHLIPLPIGEHSWAQSDTAYLKSTLSELRFWVAENARTLRRFLSSLKLGIDLDALEILELNRDTQEKDLVQFLDHFRTKGPIGLCSEAGLPCIADPGNRLVFLAHQRNMRICPYTGPSSLLLALSASGLEGQHFTFHGYAPVKTEELHEHFQELNRDKHRQHSHLYIEAPYRSDRFLELATKALDADWQLCVAKNLQSTEEEIRTQSLSQWKKQLGTLGKTPCLFILAPQAAR
ncbi:MAG: SAM-dependent methyltransferase, partial [Bacteroidia bacterium]